MKKISRAKSSYANIPAELSSAANPDIVEEGEYELLDISNLSFADQTIKLLKFEDCLFRGGGFGGNKITDVKIKNVRFEETDLANTRLDTALLEDVEFIKCRMTGFKIIEGSLRNVLFKNCQLKLSQFRMSKFKNVKFINCILEEADFYGADLCGSLFEACDLAKAEMGATKLEQTDFRSSKIHGMNLSIENLKGAIIEPGQINDLAWLLGVKIDWK